MTEGNISRPGNERHGQRALAAPAIADVGIVAILRARTSEHLDATADTLIDEGIRCLELTFSTPDAVVALQRLTARLPPDVQIGAGTIRTRQEADAAVDAGASFERAWRGGASAVKLFPASSGGITHLRELQAPMPEVSFLPAGGIKIDDVSAYLGACVVGVGLRTERGRAG